MLEAKTSQDGEGEGEIHLGILRKKWGLQKRRKVNSPCHIGAVVSWVPKFALAWVCFTSHSDWLAKLAPLFQQIRSETKNNRVLLARVFPRLAPVTCICFEFWLVHCAVSLLWLVRAINLVMVLRHSTENRSTAVKELVNKQFRNFIRYENARSWDWNS